MISLRLGYLFEIDDAAEAMEEREERFAGYEVVHHDALVDLQAGQDLSIPKQGKPS